MSSTIAQDCSRHSGSSNLVADSSETTGLKWQAPAGSDKTFTLISTTTLSTGSPTSITISGLNYDEIIVQVVEARTNANADEYFIDPTCGTTTNSRQTELERITTGNMLGQQRNSARVSIGGNAANTSNVHCFFHYRGCKSTSRKQVFAVGGSETTGSFTQGGVISGFIEATAALTAITFSTNGGGAFTNGTMYVYGA